MKVYLVGGAVRDQLLGYPVREKDWVVVGASPEQMQALGYQQVGKDFPVFLHPKTKEEYALARKERKQGHGYSGFTCDTSPSITLEEDLQRRDLTINAMAIDEQAQLVDPYQGMADLKAKRLHHVSLAFSEDPVRVLRVARFMARYHHLGFQVAQDTWLLMYNMARQGELQHLVAERVWQEWQGSLTEKNPECFIQTLRHCGALVIILPELQALFGVPALDQQDHYVDAGINSLTTLQQMAAWSSSPQLRFAALVHDLGKAKTPMTDWPLHPDDGKAGLECIIALCHRLKIPAKYRDLALLVAKWHRDIPLWADLPANRLLTVLEQSDAFRRPVLFEQLLLVCEATAAVANHPDPSQARLRWQQLFTACQALSPQTYLEKGYKGEAIKIQLQKQRLHCIEALIKTWNHHEK